jgi:hypothetical protein
LDSLEIIILGALEKIFNQNHEISMLVCQQRAKFEGWLKFELACALTQHPDFQKLRLEDSYESNGRADVSFEYNGQKWFAEIKTANTNWQIDGIESRARPITLNMQSIAKDILKLKQESKLSHGMAIFCIFPISEHVRKSKKLIYHLETIKKECGMNELNLENGSKYIPLTPAFGVYAFAVAVS